MLWSDHLGAMKQAVGLSALWMVLIQLSVIGAWAQVAAEPATLPSGPSEIGNSAIGVTCPSQSVVVNAVEPSIPFRLEGREPQGSPWGSPCHTPAGQSVRHQDQQTEQAERAGAAATIQTEKDGETEDDAQAAADKKKESRFVRVRQDESGRMMAMETSTVPYTKKLADGSELRVELIGVVHIGELDYYKAFNEQFKKYDALLYELVAPEGTRIDRRDAADNMNPVAALQKGMMVTLGLKFQLDHIDYGPDNFVHADMTPEEFAQSMRDNNESVAKMFFRTLGMSAATQGSSGEVDMLRALFSSGEDRIYRLRRSFAKQLINMELGMIIFEGDEGSTIITHRNAKAFQVLQSEIDAGKRNIGVFYGAGHLEDMERRLIEDFGMTAGQPQWQRAWKLQADTE